MNLRNLGVISSVGLIAFAISGCSIDNRVQNININNKANEIQMKIDNYSNNEDNNPKSKEGYIKELNGVEGKIENLYYNKTDKSDIKEAQKNELKIWDNELSKIYKTLETELDKKEVDKLKSSEVEWIKSREKNAQNAVRKVKILGSENIVYEGSIIKSTEDRCYQLVNDYM